MSHRAARPGVNPSPEARTGVNKQEKEMTTPGEQGIRAAKWDAVVKDRRLAAFDGAREGMGGRDRVIYFSEMLAALDEHLNDTAKDGDAERMEMYAGAILAVMNLRDKK